MSIAEMMRKARKEKHITQQQLADAVGLSVMTIRRYEARNEKTRRTPTINECQKIAAILGLSWHELMGLEDFGNGVYGRGMEPDKASKWVERLTLTDDNIDESVLIDAFNMLNTEGKRECIKRALELTELQRYREG